MSETIDEAKSNREARAAIALLRAWVNQSLDFAALAAVQPEE